MTKLDHLRALARVCADFGGKLAIVSQDEFDDLFDVPRDQQKSHWPPWHSKDLSAAPFTSAHGQWWRRKIVYAVKGREEIGSIIHEMGHVFATEHHPDHACTSCHEWNWFGWEIALARHIGASRTWSRHNASYRIDDEGTQWDEIEPTRRHTVVRDRLARARQLGVLDQGGLLRSAR